MYARNMARVEGETLPRSLFAALAAHVPERVRVFTARVDGEVVGRYVHLLDEETSTLHHWLSAIPDRSCYDAHPSELLHERAIRWGIDEGYDTYSFDRAGSHFDNGVFRFKSKYGARPVPLLRWERGQSRVAWPAFRAARRWYRARAR
jgi:predicted N-acyltransferase